MVKGDFSRYLKVISTLDIYIEYWLSCNKIWKKLNEDVNTFFQIEM